MPRKSKQQIEHETLQQVISHYQMWKEDNDVRRERTNGWNDITDAYWGKLPDDWPYYSKVVDPRIRTSLVEKNSRLLNSKLRGRLVPRESSDQIKARINNSILDFQWDHASHGGSMLAKWAMMDMDTRLYGSKFALVSWFYQEDDEGNPIFDGNEFFPIDIRDSGIDPVATGIKDANWFQHRQWVTVQSLMTENDLPTGETKYPGLNKLLEAINAEKEKIKAGNVSAISQNRRDTEYETRVRHLKGLTDRVGDDDAFPIVELVTEYRKNRWITFAPKYKVLLRDIDNPYLHGQIPIVQLRYYPLGDDPIGESEVEPVMPLWKAIQAVLNGYLDNMNIHIRPPLKILESAVRLETIEFGPEAQWLMDRIDAVSEHQGSGEALAYFQTTYQALVAAFNVAMGDLSQGTSNTQMFGSGEKTATEVRQIVRQQTMRDQNNQMYLAEALQDMMFMWLSNNKQFLFADPNKHQHVLRIVGESEFEYFKRSGMDMMVPADGAPELIADIITMTDGQMSDQQIRQMFESSKVPRFPVIENPDDPEDVVVKPKMMISENGDEAELAIVREDLEGEFDYIADVKSMAAGAAQEQIQGRQQAMQLMTGNPTVLQLLQQEGKRPNISEILVDVFRDAGVRDAERYFVPTQMQTPQEQQIPQEAAAELDGQMDNAGTGGQQENLGRVGGAAAPTTPFQLPTPGIS